MGQDNTSEVPSSFSEPLGTGSLGSYSHVIDTVWSEGVICLVSQGGTVLGYVVVGLRHINDRFLVKGEGIPIESPVPAVDLQKTRK